MKLNEDKNTAQQETRLERVQQMSLRAGIGKSIDEKLCVMQAVDYVATGGVSDHPECACPILTSYAIRLNDRADNEQRQLLKPLVPMLIGTRDGRSKDRAEHLVLNSITKVLPILVRATGLDADAAKLESFKYGEWKEMKTFCYDLKPRLRQAMIDKLKETKPAAAYVAADAAAAAVYVAADAAAAAVYVAAAAADVAANSKKYWRDVQSQIWQQALLGLKQACEIRSEEKVSPGLTHVSDGKKDG